jgi:hypothetical protein
MTRAGTDEAGYSIEVGAFGVRVRAWGFWGASVAGGFSAAVLEALQAAPQRGRLQVDAALLKPQRDEGQAAFRELVQATTKLANFRAELVVTNAITKMQLARIIRETSASTWSVTAPTSSAPAGGGP